MKNTILVIIGLLLISLLGCSGGGKSPVTPLTHNVPVLGNGDYLAGISEYFPDGTPAGGFGTFGLFDVIINRKI